ncbi:fumarylacetoacetate hydrolase family protein [Bacillus sp. es.034]|jgi:2-keto-4-pentenoate hydratase/2-oxohepta-3-ene-1,7-dioic acid hydratase in catechol pathway|uniref:fumarylacetoacetate hydrolase family protein n=1 Tax=Bacillus sp. es.034 TaxID=1761763 RepID=UPI000BF844DC|nr:fumarylacetoacetate hydrolase family protein [Bacillus sp. es.034]PFG07089.1 2-keto-4-pentenoate hydratase/2-oxohepta-3-ene-1,7-dioic acid hydratase in catechol pathway [Bacillus sp. es.034]
MKFVSYAVEGKETYGVEVEGRIIDLAGVDELPGDLLQGIEAGEGFLQRVEGVLRKNAGALPSFAKDEVQWLSPITKVKRNIMCVGKNYREHAIEMGGEQDIPKNIMIFTKATQTVIGHGETVLHHDDITEELDYEGELAVIIGKKGRGISPEEAMDHVFGYSILNDITARDLQKKHGQFFIGKSLDTTCPMGPFLVTKDEVDDPQNLTITTMVNGEIRQSSNTGQMIFSIPTIISTLSKGMTLLPGDVIATGTPSGVGKGYKPPRFLRKGDVVEIEIEGLGVLTNPLQD